jgi:hypothetical protein
VSGWFREGFYLGSSLALVTGLFLLWLWRPERQVRFHSEHLLHAIEQKSWSGVTDFIADDYRDQWGNDRTRLRERMREVLRYLRGLHIEPSNVNVRVDRRRGYWTAKITIDGEQGEVTELVNSLGTPFQLEWRRRSGKPWAWKLVGITNSSLELPAGFD